MRNLDECPEGRQSDCIERVGGDITIHDSFANIVDTGFPGITTRYRADFKTDWGEIGLSGAWRHVTDADLRIEGNQERYATSRNMARIRFEARRGILTATWTVNHRAGFRNRADTGDFDDWTGHDVALDWNGPPGLEGARITAGVFNPHRRRPHGRHREPGQRGRPRGGRLGTHVLPDAEQELLTAACACVSCPPCPGAAPGIPRSARLAFSDP